MVTSEMRPVSGQEESIPMKEVGTECPRKGIGHAKSGTSWYLSIKDLSMFLKYM